MRLHVSNSSKVYFLEAYLASVPMKLVFFYDHLPSVLLLLRQRHMAAGSSLGTGLGTTVTYVRPKMRPATPLFRRYIAARVTFPLCTSSL